MNYPEQANTEHGKYTVAAQGREEKFGVPVWFPYGVRKTFRS